MILTLVPEKYQALNSESNSLTFEVLFLFISFDRGERATSDLQITLPGRPFRQKNRMQPELVCCEDW